MQISEELPRFPPDFLWGATLSAYQVEGHNYHTDWWRWEQRPGRISGGGSARTAAAHYERFRADYALARKLGMRAMLVALDWARIEPEPGEFDDAALAHYQESLECLRSLEIEPIVALHHVALPAWAAGAGGWRHSDTAARFAAYAEKTAATLAPLCTWWLPLYEPAQWLFRGYIEGAWPPERRSPLKARAAFHQGVRAFSTCREALRSVRSGVRVGLPVLARRFAPADEQSAWDLRTARRLTDWFTHAFPRALSQDPGAAASNAPASASPPAFDFIAVSFQGLEWVQFSPARPRQWFMKRVAPPGRRSGAPPGPASAPEAFAEALRELAAYQRPMLVAGAGTATDNDEYRCRYLLDHIAALGTVMREGIDVRGYLARSFLDGFEWTLGFDARYGLVHVDTRTLARTPNPSAYLFKGIAEANGVSAGLAARFCPGWPGA